MSLCLGEVLFFKKVKDIKVLKYKRNKDKIYRATELKNFLTNPTPNNLPKKPTKEYPKKSKQLQQIKPVIIHIIKNESTLVTPSDFFRDDSRDKNCIEGSSTKPPSSRPPAEGWIRHGP